MNKKKILYLSYDGLTDQLSNSQILPYLKILNEFFKVFVLTCEKNKNKDRISGIATSLKKDNINFSYLYFTNKFYFITIFRIYDSLKILFKLIQIILTKKINLIHARGHLPAFICLIVKFLFNVDYVFDFRGLWIEERIDNKSLRKETIFGATLYNFLKFYEKITIKKSCKIVVLTENLKSKLISEYSISDNNIIVIPCYVDIDLFNKNISKNQIDLKNELRVPKNSKIICYLGSIGGFYLINEMLSFFLELKKKHHEYYLLIITRQIDEFKYLVKKLNNPLLDKSIFYKNLEYNEVPKYLMNVKFSIFFLKNSDARIGTCPIKFAESIALGVPVICNSGVGDLDRYFKENNIGALIDLQKNSTKEFLINNIDKLENLSKKKIKKYALDNFSIKNAFYKYKLLYINHI